MPKHHTFRHQKDGKRVLNRILLLIIKYKCLIINWIYTHLFLTCSEEIEMLLVRMKRISSYMSLLFQKSLVTQRFNHLFTYALIIFFGIADISKYLGKSFLMVDLDKVLVFFH